MDLTPLIDVVFLLLIFFIVASEFKKNESILNLTLPTSSSSQKIVKKKEIMIEMTKDKLAFNSKELSFKDLKQELMSLSKKTPITVKIDKEVKYEKIIELLDILKSSNMKNLQLITKENKII